MSQARPNQRKGAKIEADELNKPKRSRPSSSNTSPSASSLAATVDDDKSPQDDDKCSANTSLSSTQGDQEEILISSRPDSSSSPSSISTRNMLIYYGKEALCLVAIILTTMASYQGSTPKVGRPPTPRQFFPSGSMVYDYPAGNLDAVSQQVSLSELSFVFYYAPWCANSQSARAPFADVAQFYNKEAYFSAINCWQPGGECRIQYSKIKAWPVLMAYLPKNGLGVLYNGPWERDPMMRFVTSFLNPLKRLNDPDDLLQEMTGHDAIVVAFVDMQQDVREWNIYYETAVKWMYRDAFQDIRFSIVTGESRSKFGVDTTEPVLRMYLWNETLEYDNTTWTTSGIESWTTQQIHRVALWMTPTGYKSMSLANYFKNGPVLIFFTPRNMLKESTDAMEMMRQIGMEYYNCNRDEWIREMVREYLPGQRKEHQEELKKLRGYCQGYMSTLSSFRKPVSITFANLMNGSSQMNVNDRIEDICQLETDLLFTKGRNVDASAPQGHCERESCETLDKDDAGMRLRETSLLRNEFDRRSPVNLEKLAMRRRCELLFIDTEQAVNSFLGAKPFEIDQLQGIEAMGCSSNRTLTLLLMDSSIYHVFAERLGVDILKTKKKSGVTIIDPENESSYVLNPSEDLTLKSISRFIRKFHEGTLRRHLRSSHLDYIHTHFYTKCPLGEYPKRNADKKERRQIHLDELTSKNFASVMAMVSSTGHGSSSNRSLLIFFYSSNCAFCTMMSSHLLQIANVLRPLTDAGHLRMMRIDGDKNDLPWPYTVAEYPTLIFFPGRGGTGGGGDSRQFSISERNSVQLDKVLGFIVANLDRPVRIYAIQLTCAASRRSVKSLGNCLASLRTEIHDSISVSLREWRRAAGIVGAAAVRGTVMKSRARIVRRLQLLEAFYLETFKISEGSQCESCDFTKLEGYCKRIVGVWGGSN